MHIPFCLYHRPRIIDWDPQPLFLGLSNRPREPPPRPQEPTPERPKSHDTHRDRSVVERLAVDRIDLGKTKDDGDEGDVKYSHRGDGAGGGTEVEGTFGEIAGIDEADEDGEAVGYV